MFKALFNIIINLLGTVIQIVVWPINEAIKATMPSISDQILQVSNVLSNVFDCLSWALGLLPSSVTATLLFIITVEIAKHTIKISTSTLIKVWNVIQKVKFW